MKILVLLALASAGCRTPGDSHYIVTDNYCEVHHVPMEKQVVPVQFGLPCRAPKYNKALDHKFPHGEQFYAAGCVVAAPYHSRIYICSECLKARTAYLATHERCE